MSYGETKVYYDGSHYIAIPKSTKPYHPKSVQSPEEIITVTDNSPAENTAESTVLTNVSAETDKEPSVSVSEPQKRNKRRMTKKQLFDELYRRYIDLPYKERYYKIMDAMEAYFDSIEELKWYVDLGFERKYRNIICRRVRMYRKARLANVNWFITFTYADKKCTEEEFRKKIKIALCNLSVRNGWKYMCVWEHGSENGRLHLHGLFHIPENGMTGELIQTTDYSIKRHRMETITQNTYFLERFGRNEFDELDPHFLGSGIEYLCKYLEKDNDRIMYSKGMYQYFISDIMDEDIASPYGAEQRKLLLLDNFRCWDEGVYMGRDSPEVIDKMRKSN